MNPEHSWQGRTSHPSGAGQGHFELVMPLIFCISAAWERRGWLCTRGIQLRDRQRIGHASRSGAAPRPGDEGQGVSESPAPREHCWGKSRAYTAADCHPQQCAESPQRQERHFTGNPSSSPLLPALHGQPVPRARALAPCSQLLSLDCSWRFPACLLREAICSAATQAPLSSRKCWENPQGWEKDSAPPPSSPPPAPSPSRLPSGAPCY